jgi:4-hydroxybenzoate polyprenyltransferase
MLALAQLLRLPNVFTAFADIALAACAAGYLADRPGTFALLLVASGCLYLGGMAWNDFFDRHEDAKTQAFRPIPSGRVSARTAAVIASTLTVVGVVAGTVAAPGPIPVVLAATILLYDGWLKWTPVGPLAMGSCRFLNVLMGLSAAADPLAGPSLHLAGVVGVYIVGVTWFARTEETDSSRTALALAGGVMLKAMLLAVLVPAHLPAGTSPVYYPYLLVAFGVYVGSAVVAAVQDPHPKRVQAAVKRCILGLVLLDAILATCFVGAWGFLIGLLLLPARWLGKWVYST